MLDQEAIATVAEEGTAPGDYAETSDSLVPATLLREKDPVNLRESVTIGMAWAFLLAFSIGVWSVFLYFLF